MGFVVVVVYESRGSQLRFTSLHLTSSYLISAESICAPSGAEEWPSHGQRDRHTF